MNSDCKIREITQRDMAAAVAIWNHVVEEGIAFPQTDYLDEKTGGEFFAAQSYTGVAYDSETKALVGMYILHPNNVGRCGHICNASFAVKEEMRGHHVGERLVTHCMAMGKTLGFRVLQFNAVVANNTAALHLYKKLGFVQMGRIPGGFLMKDGTYQDIIPQYHVL